MLRRAAWALRQLHSYLSVKSAFKRVLFFELVFLPLRSDRTSSSSLISTEMHCSLQSIRASSRTSHACAISFTTGSSISAFQSRYGCAGVCHMPSCLQNALNVAGCHYELVLLHQHTTDPLACDLPMSIHRTPLNCALSKSSHSLLCTSQQLI